MADAWTSQSTDTQHRFATPSRLKSMNMIVDTARRQTNSDRHCLSWEKLVRIYTTGMDILCSDGCFRAPSHL
jgi:hypothetical protein